MFFREGAGRYLRQQVPHLVHALLPQEAYLPVPVAGVRVALDAKLLFHRNFRHRVFLRALFLADADGQYLCHSSFLPYE
jgi:hypothetical protein